MSRVAPKRSSSMLPSSLIAPTEQSLDEIGDIAQDKLCSNSTTDGRKASSKMDIRSLPISAVSNRLSSNMSAFKTYAKAIKKIATLGSTEADTEYRNSVLRNGKDNFAVDALMEAKNATLGQFMAVVHEAIEKNRNNQSAIYPFVLYPNSYFRKVWDIVLLLCLFYVGIFLPVQLSFYSDKMNLTNIDDWLLVFVFDRVTDIIFFLDIAVNFRSAWLNDKGEVLFHWKVAASSYISSWLIIDLLSLIPFDIIVYYISDHNTTPAALRIPKLLKLLRLAKIWKVVNGSNVFKRYEETISIKYGWLRLMKFTGAIMVMSHWLGCALYVAALVSAGSGRTWIDKIDGNQAGDYYWASMYWAIMTLTTIGYGDITAHSTLERIVFSVLMLIGAGMYAYVVGTMCSLVQGLDVSTLEFQRQMDEVNEFMHVSNIPSSLRLRIRKYMLYKRDSKAITNSNILTSLSPSIRQEIALHRFHTILAKVPQFRGAPLDFLGAIALSFKSVIFGPNELIIMSGRSGDSMFILNKGRVQLEKVNIQGELSVCKPLPAGIYFGERSLLMQTKRKASIRALTYVETSVLTRTNFNYIMEDYPSVKRTIRKSMVKEIIWRSLGNGRLRELAEDEAFLKKRKAIISSETNRVQSCGGLAKCNLTKSNSIDWTRDLQDITGECESSHDELKNIGTKLSKCQIDAEVDVKTILCKQKMLLSQFSQRLEKCENAIERTNKTINHLVCSIDRLSDHFGLSTG